MKSINKPHTLNPRPQTLILLSVMGFLLLTGCDLFNSQREDDLLKLIDDEIAWAHAKKIEVTVAYPADWGSSPQEGNGCFDDVRTNEKPREAYPFTVSFSPSSVYSFAGWLAFPTKELERLDQDLKKQNENSSWRDNNAMYLDFEDTDTETNEDTGIKIVKRNSDVIIEPLKAGSNQYRITVNTTEPITLVPWCRDMPRITMTTPADKGLYARDQVITITFAAPVRENSNFYEAGNISIQMRDKNSTGDWTLIAGEGVLESYYDNPQLDPISQRTITINPIGAGPPGEQDITVTIGTGIKSLQGNNGMDKAFKFSWTTFKDSDISVGDFYAVCNAAGKSITVHWTREGRSEDDEFVIPARIRYYRDNISAQPITANAAAVSVNISTPSINTNNVRSGEPVSNVYQYDISVDLLSGTSVIASKGPLRIWNIPGMSVSIDNPAILIEEAAHLQPSTSPGGRIIIGFAGVDKSYVLTNSNIVLDSHSPLCPGEYTQFQGKFYGNGHTITMSGWSWDDNNATVDNIGLFSRVNGHSSSQPAIIRDLTVVVKANMTVKSSTSGYANNVGGIAGQASGNTRIINCIVKGADMEPTKTATLEVSANYQTHLGGIVGFMGNTDLMERTVNVDVENCQAALNVTLSTTSNIQLYVGGVVGRSESSGTLIVITGVNTVSMNKTGTTARSGINYCGGIAGYLENTNLSDCVFSGKIDIPLSFKASNNSFIGGLVGDYEKKGTADKCSTTGDIIVRSSGSGPIYLGGVIGQVYGSGDTSRVEITNTVYSDGIIRLESDNSTQRVGGFTGSLMRYSRIEKCHSNALNITALIHSGSYSVLIGGFAGQMVQADISNCSSTSPVIIPIESTSTGGAIAGGFSGTLASYDSVKSTVSNCFATGDVTVHSRGSSIDPDQGGSTYIGGFVGASYISNLTTSSAVNTISKCYATGNVSVLHYKNGLLPGAGSGGLVGLARSTDIIESYATGNVTARKDTDGTAPLTTGGLVGFLGWTSSDNSAQKSSITNCYATGNVSADNPEETINASLYTGGLVGYIQIDAGKAVTHSFATGSVSGRNASSISTPSAAVNRAGGIVGYRASGLLQNNAALGNSVTVTGGDTTVGSGNHVAGRIYGYLLPLFPLNESRPNFAKNSMHVEMSGDYNDFSPEVVTISGIQYDYSPHGQAIADSSFYSQNVWTNASYLHFDSSNISPWDFNTVVGRGYPVLKGLSGQ